EPRRGLVEEQDARSRHDRARDGEQPTLAVREVLGDATEVVLKPELLDDADGLAAERQLARMREIGEVRQEVVGVDRRLEIREHGRVLEELERLEGPRDPRTCAARGRQASDV